MLEKPQKILIIKLGALGDFIMQLDYVFAIHHLYPNAHLSFMTTKPFVPFVKALPFKVENIFVDTKPKYNLVEWIRTCKTNIADQQFDMIFDLQASKRTRQKYFNIARFFSHHSFKWYLIAHPKDTILCVRKKHSFCLGKKTTESFVIMPSKIDLSFIKGEQKHFDELPNKAFVLMIPGCSSAHLYKRWPAEKYKQLALLFEKEGIPCVVLGTNQESTEISTICNQTNAVSFQNKASLLDIPALAQKSCCVVGNDTGPVHMASLCNRPSVVLFCEKTAKSGQKQENICNLVKPDIADITVNEVYTTLHKMMEKSLHLNK